MPLSLILALIVAVIGALVITLGPLAITGQDEYGRGRRTPSEVATARRALRLGLGVGFGAVVGILLFSASATIVPTRSVGVEVNFGRPVGTLQNGFHLVAPWHRVEKFDASVQTLVLAGDGSGRDGPCVTVRLGNQTTACVDVTRAQWDIDPNGDVIELYRRYKRFDRIEQNVVAGQTMNALVNTLSTFDPLSGVTGTNDAPMRTSEDLAAAAKAKAQAAVGSGVHLDTLLIFIHYDPVTQTKLDGYAQALADTRIAIQRKSTAEQIALANKALASQSSVTNPGVQYQNCLDLVSKLAASGQLKDLPPTFNCGDPRSQVIVGGGR